MNSYQINFPIKSKEKISRRFLARGITSFDEAAHYIQQLPYGRNANKNDLTTIFSDNCGTCSTKHALLKSLATENNFNDLQLMLGLFKMNGKNTPRIVATLQKYGLDYIPEAHNYLRYKNEILDFTFINSKPSDFEDDLIEEIEIAPNQIADFKVAYHKEHLSHWLTQNNQIKYSLNELWAIREECIKDMYTK